MSQVLCLGYFEVTWHVFFHTTSFGFTVLRSLKLLRVFKSTRFVCKPVSHRNPISGVSVNLQGGLVAERLARWTQAQKGPGSNRSRDAVGELFKPIVPLFTKQGNW